MKRLATLTSLFTLLAALPLSAADKKPASTAAASSSSDDATALAKQTQNPVADLISVPFQNNFNFGIGPENVTQWICNVQPVIPITLNEDWNLITRVIMPIINQPAASRLSSSAFGLGDINPSFFLSPAKPGKLIWGVGPALTFPTATNPELGSGKYSAGPSVVLLTMQGPWVVGVLANNQWSYAGWGDEPFNQMLIQYFINYNFGHGTYLSSAPIITANWNAKGEDVWTVPVGLAVGQIFKVGKLPINAQIGAFYNVHHPKDGADWQLRAQVQLLFPKK